ncbi:MAG: hypothetical protein ABR514_06165, partial [Chthoniobacterales bacterium]
SPARAKVLAEPELLDYFAGELKTLPPAIAHRPLFEKIRARVSAIQTKLRASAGQLSLGDVEAIHMQARELNSTIRELHDGR